MSQQIVLGIDPGTHHMGYAFLCQNGSHLRLLSAGVLTASKTKALAYRLAHLAKDLEDLMLKFKPEFLAVETIFYSKNIKALSSLAHARGVVLMLGEKNQLSIHEYSPIEVKKASCGYGRAEKSQVAQMLSHLFPQLRQVKKYDLTDAVAVALCHLNTWKTREKLVHL